MEHEPCPFSQALLPGDFACPHGRVVTRREGPAVACDAPHTHVLCAEVLAHLKAVGLPALGYSDDLEQLPHGVAMKVQMGGSLGLKRLLGSTVGAAVVVEDLGAVVAAAVARYGSPAAIPYADLVADMASFQIKRRRGR